MKLRFTEVCWELLVAVLLARLDVETMAVLHARPLDTGKAGEPIYVVEKVETIPDDGYDVRRIDQLHVKPEVLIRATRSARQKGRAVITIHTHPMSDLPWFSLADDLGDQELMPAFHTQIPGLLHGSMVLARSGKVCARFFDADLQAHEVRVSVVGKQLRRIDIAVREGTAKRFSRQTLALGAAGQAQLAELRVGVVGAGGTGSVVAALLSHLGVGILEVFDADLIEAHNVSRGLGNQAEDIGQLRKVQAAARYAGGLGGRTQIIAHPTFLQGEEELRRLRACDVIVSCVDREIPRALLNGLVYEALVPLIDVGTVFQVDAHGKVQADAGRVVLAGPGRPCLACWGELNPDQLRLEAMSEEDRAFEIEAGYIQGADEVQPSVMSFNTSVSAAAVTELLRIVTGFAGTDNPPGRLAFSFAKGTVRRNTVVPSPACIVCGKSNGQE